MKEESYSRSTPGDRPQRGRHDLGQPSRPSVQAGVGKGLISSPSSCAKTEMIIVFASVPTAPTGACEGFHGPIEVEVTVLGGKVTAVRILSR